MSSLARLALGPLAVAAFIYYDAVLSFASQFAGWTILRTNNSRDVVWGEALSAIREHPILGSGAGNLNILGGNSFLKLWAEHGVLSIPMVIVVGILVFKKVQDNWLNFGLAAGSFVSAMFESWAFVPGSLYFVLFCILISAQEGYSRDSVGSIFDNAAIRSYPQRTHRSRPRHSRGLLTRQ